MQVLPRWAYTPPKQETTTLLLSSLRHLHESGQISLSLNNVVPSERLPWARETHVYDFGISWDPHPESFFDAAPVQAFGSALNQNPLQGICHAASECLERIVRKLGGETSARPSRQSAWSIANQQWQVFSFNPAHGRPNDGHGAGLGEAFHLDESEAIRASFCEFEERRQLVLLENGQADVTNISDLAISSIKSLQVIDAWARERGLRLALFVLGGPQSIYTVVAYLVRMSCGFPEAFRGSASDFDLARPIEQAVGEAVRSCCFGTAVRLTEISSARSHLESLSSRDFEYGLVKRMMSGDAIRDLIQKAPTSDVWPKRQGSAHDTYHAICVAQKLSLVPLYRSQTLFPGYAYKIFSPIAQIEQVRHEL